MKLKLLSTFLAGLLLISFTQTTFALGIKEVNTTRPLNNIRFSAKSETGTYGPVSQMAKNKVIPILNKLPENHLSALRSLVFDYNPKAHRGLGRGNLIMIRAINMSDKEFFAVLIHELGHSVDIGVIHSDRGGKSAFNDYSTPVYKKDASLDFYQISWLSDQKRKSRVSNEDFVSGYAMENPFEDFAETYAYYVLHNKSFQVKSRTNRALKAKYEYMKQLFNGHQFNTGSTKNSKSIPWDVTKLDYDLGQFLTK